MNKLRLITGVFQFSTNTIQQLSLATKQPQRLRSMPSNQEHQPNNPLHGVKLSDIMEYLTQKYSWEDLAGQVNINCFKSNPSIKSSLKLLRRTPWAREKIEHLYLQSIGS